MIYIFDVEGTLSQSKWREHLIPDWDLFHANFPQDEPNGAIAEFAKEIIKNKNIFQQNIIITGMMEKHRDMLISWLCKNKIHFMGREIYMRPSDDLRPSKIYKFEKIKELFGEEKFNEILMIDDREDICDYLTKNGIKCLRAYS